MRGLGFGLQLGAATQAGGAAAVAGASWALSGVGAEANWSLANGFLWFPPLFFENGGGADPTASLTGAALTAQDAAWPNSTLASLTLTADPNGIFGTLTVAVKGGTAVNFVFTGGASQQVTHDVTSGAGSGFVITSPIDGDSGFLADIDIP